MNDAPVLIVGGGPVGLAVSLDLALRGIASIVIEKQPRTGAELLAKASALNERSLEICRWWGIRDAVANCVPDDVNMDNVYCTSLDGHLLGVDPRPPARDRIAPYGALEIMRKIPQYEFDAILARTLAGTPRAQVLYGHNCDRIEQDDTGVTAYVTETGTGRRKTVRARYAVAADGASSNIRRQLGLRFDGPVLSYSASVMLRANLDGTKFGIRNRYMFIDTTGTWANLTAINLRDLWRLTIIGDETKKFDPENHDISSDVRRAFGPDYPFEILHVSYWRRSECIIEKYRHGRVLFAGDSAHTTSPTGAHGLNTGIGDALALGWMLHGVLSGYAGPGLLDAYEAERRPVAMRNSAVSTQNFKSWISGYDFSKVLDEGPAGDAARHEAGQALSSNLYQEWTSPGTALGYRYEHSPVIVPDGTPQPPDEVHKYVPTSRPGHRAPHAWLGDGRSIIDLFGREFVLLMFPGAPDVNDLIKAAEERIVPLSVVTVDAAPEAESLYQRKLVLVRPDGHVAWRDDRSPDDPGSLMDRVTGRRKVEQ